MIAQDFEVLTNTVYGPVDPLNGKFTVCVESLDYRDDSNDEFKLYFSTTQVRVENNEAVINDLVKAAQELHEQTGYWGRYIESLEYDPDTNTILISFGS